MIEFLHTQEGPDDRYVAQLEAEIQKLRDVIERACGALTTLGATNRERVQAAGLILLSANQSQCCEPRKRKGRTQ